jgi:MFS superfamily sulfate permease-like transporter
VIDAGAITDLDYSAARAVSELCQGLARRGIVVLFSRVNPYLRTDLDRHGITGIIGADHVFVTLHQALASVKSLDASCADILEQTP